MFKAALNNNIIPHMWKLANMVPIQKSNKYTDKGTSYRPISLLLLIDKTLEKNLLPYITENIPDIPTEHGCKAQRYTVTALHTLNNTVAKGFKQMALPARTITVAIDMSKAFDAMHMHTLIRELLLTNNPGTITKFIANCIKHQAKPTQHTVTTHPYNVNLKLALPKVAFSHPHYLHFRLTTTQSTITSTHTSTSAAHKYIQPRTCKKFLPGQNLTISH